MDLFNWYHVIISMIICSWRCRSFPWTNGWISSEDRNYVALKIDYIYIDVSLWVTRKWNKEKEKCSVRCNNLSNFFFLCLLAPKNLCWWFKPAWDVQSYGIIAIMCLPDVCPELYEFFLPIFYTIFNYKYLLNT